MISNGDNGAVPAYWTASRIANRLYRTGLAAAGFSRAGQTCERRDGGLHRTLSVHTRSSGAGPKIQLLVDVAVAGLPEPVTGHRCDSLGGAADTAAGRHWYPLPASDQPLPPDLLTDVSGRLLEFLLAAQDLDGFILWTQQIHLERPGRWGRFGRIQQQGTGPLEAAAFAAAAKGDTQLVDLLAARVENEQVGEHAFDDFMAELRQLSPGIQPRHPIVRPVT